MLSSPTHTEVPVPAPEPADNEDASRIRKLANYVVKNGPNFEDIVRNKEKDNIKFSFLNGGNYSQYYKWILFCLRQSYSDNQIKAVEDEFRNIITDSTPGSIDLTNEDKLKLVNLLQHNNGSKESIRETRKWIIERSHSCTAIILQIKSYIKNIVPGPGIFQHVLHTIYVLNDILFNQSSAKMRGPYTSICPDNILDKHVNITDCMFYPLGYILHYAYKLTETSEDKEKLSKIIKLWEAKAFFDEPRISYMNLIMAQNVTPQDPPVPTLISPYPQNLPPPTISQPSTMQSIPNAAMASPQHQQQQYLQQQQQYQQQKYQQQQYPQQDQQQQLPFSAPMPPGLPPRPAFPQQQQQQYQHHQEQQQQQQYPMSLPPPMPVMNMVMGMGVAGGMSMSMSMPPIAPGLPPSTATATTSNLNLNTMGRISSFPSASISSLPLSLSSFPMNTAMKTTAPSPAMTLALDIQRAPVGYMANIVRAQVKLGHKRYLPIDVGCLAQVLTPFVEPGRLEARVNEFYRRLKQKLDVLESSHNIISNKHDHVMVHGDNDNGNENVHRMRSESHHSHSSHSSNTSYDPDRTRTCHHHGNQYHGDDDDYRHTNPNNYEEEDRRNMTKDYHTSDYNNSSQSVVRGRGRSGSASTSSSATHTAIAEENMGHMMLRGLGWQQGEGLGAGGQGRVEPLLEARNRDKEGVGSGVDQTVHSAGKSFASYRSMLSGEYHAKIVERDGAR
eukprot:gene252-467_t